MEGIFSQIIFPHYCLLCHKENFLLCPDCQQTIKINQIFSCPLCADKKYFWEICSRCKQKYNFSLDGIFVTGFWQDPLVKKLIYFFKYEFVLEAGKILEQNLINFVKINEIFRYAVLPKKDIIVIPVPLHKKRLLWRGFNQSELLGQALATEFNLTDDNTILSRKINTFPQMGLPDAKSRKRNVYAAFCVNQSIKTSVLKDKIIFLVDDLTTTGATLDECARVLKKYRPKKIYGLVLARG